MFETSPTSMSRRCCYPRPRASGSASQPVSLADVHRHSHIGTFTHQILLDHVNADPTLAQAFPRAVRGVPGALVPPINVFDTSRSHKALGIEPRDEGKTAIDMTESLRERNVKWDVAASQ